MPQSADRDQTQAGQEDEEQVAPTRIEEAPPTAVEVPEERQARRGLSGRQLDEYRLDALLGSGGVGEVYLAEHVVLRKRRAVKVLREDLANDAELRQRFLDEPHLASAIEHPHIVEVYDAAIADGVPYIAMRYIASDLHKVIARDGPLAPERAFTLLEQVADALDTAHAHSLIHRDVKPANILVDEHDHVFLSDFGAAKNVAAATGLSVGPTFVGTYAYAAPEQIRCERLDGRVDVYALGGVLFECLTGRRPFDRSLDIQMEVAHLEEPPPTVTSLRPGLPPGLDEVIAKAMAKSREARFTTCTDLIIAGRASCVLVDDGSRPWILALLVFVTAVVLSAVIVLFALVVTGRL